MFVVVCCLSFVVLLFISGQDVSFKQRCSTFFLILRSGDLHIKPCELSKAILRAVKIKYGVSI